MLRGVPDRELSERGMQLLLMWLRRGVSLRRASMAAGYPPEHVQTWLLHGRDPRCTSPLCATLAFEAAQIEAKKEAQYHRRIKAAASGGSKTTKTTRPGGDEETKVEEVLPAQWAIERLEKRLDASEWGIFPGEALADAILQAANESASSTRDLQVPSDGEPPPGLPGEPDTVALPP